MQIVYFILMYNGKFTKSHIHIFASHFEPDTISNKLYGFYFVFLFVLFILLYVIYGYYTHHS